MFGKEVTLFRSRAEEQALRSEEEQRAAFARNHIQFTAPGGCVLVTKPHFVPVTKSRVVPMVPTTSHLLDLEATFAKVRGTLPLR